MKKIFVLFLIVHCTLLIEHCEAQWVWQNPSTTINIIESIQFFDNNFGYAGGSYGTILKTNDGGNNWTCSNLLLNQEDKYSSGVVSISIVDANTALALTSRSDIIKTTDKGSSWNLISSVSSVFGHGEIKFINLNTGYIASSYIYKTTNGGLGWLKINTPFDDSANYTKIICLDSLNFITVNNYINSYWHSKILKTTNGGASWFEQFADIPLNFGIQDMKFINKNIGFASGVDLVKGLYSLKTTNGGAEWKSNNYWNHYELINSINFTDSLNGVITGLIGYTYFTGPLLFRTTDGCATWAKISFPDSTMPIYSSAVKNNKNIVLGCDFGIIMESSNAGLTWFNKDRRVTRENLNSVSFANSLTGITVGDKGTVLRTTNGGINWNHISLGTNISLLKVKLFSNGTGYITGDSTILYKTTNFGVNWNSIPLGGYNIVTLNNIKFFDSNTGLIIGGRAYPNVWSNVYKTTNGCASWTVDSTHFDGLVYPASMQKMVVVYRGYDPYNGEMVSLYRTTDGGNNWNNFHSSMYNEPDGYSVFFLDSSFGYLSGGYNLRYRTTNAFINFENLSYPTWISSLSAITFYNINYGLACLNGIVKTTNSGCNWYPTGNLYYNFYDICIVDDSTSFAVGQYGSIIKSNSTDILTNSKNNTTNVVRGSSLSQNYPNPFNPTTSIKYSVSSIQNVKLIVYDILGIEIETLVNGKKSPGTYEVTFDGSRLASGIYFYTLSVQNSGNSGQVFRDTKKLVLIK